MGDHIESDFLNFIEADPNDLKQGVVFLVSQKDFNPYMVVGFSQKLKDICRIEEKEGFVFCCEMKSGELTVFRKMDIPKVFFISGLVEKNA